MTNTDSILQERHIRPTSMRVLVYDILSKQNSALSLSEIESYFDKVDRTTIYRTLKTFEQKGIIHGVQEGTTIKYILCDEVCDENTHKDRHLHFYCKVCKTTTCHEEVKIPLEQLGQSTQIDEVQFLAKGICSKCVEKDR